jgi:hypothetical protein
MKKNNLLISIILLGALFPITSLFAQEEDKSFGIKFSGFVKNDAFFDSRQTVAAREGHFLLWPTEVNEDVNGNDINARPNFNILAVQSRLTGKISGPDAFGAKTSGVIEGDFFAQANDNINLFRLRHAFAKLNWEKTELLFGQTWNPFFITSCFPGTVSFNTGTPFQPFARNPQIRATHKLGPVSFIGAAVAQRDYASRGPAGATSTGATSTYLRNSGMPDFHLQTHLDLETFVTGVGVAYKKIVPEIVTDSNYKTDNGVSGLSALWFGKISTKPVTVKMEFVYGQNIPDVLQISGYGVTDIDPVTGEYTYAPLNNISTWLDVHTNGKKFQVGLFAGYTSLLGATEDVFAIEGFGTNINSMFRVSPRVIFNSGKFRFAGEIEHTTAFYGSTTNSLGVPTDITPADNLRVLFATYYFF